MHLFTTMFTMMALLGTTMTEAQTIVISRGGARSVRPGPAEHFTGSVRLETLFEAVEPSHAGGGSVTFEPGARTAWHSHPRGQILIVTAGTGRVQRWGDAIEEIRTGDVVRIPAGQKHWHGASAAAAMTHLTVSEHRDGTVVQWMEKVSDEQYNAAPQPRAVVQQAQQELISLSKEKWRWMAERNVDALSALFHEDAVFVHMGGTMSRSQELEVIKTGAIQYKQADIQDVSVKIIGTTAILLNRIRLVAVVGGNEVTNPFVVTEVYVQQGGTWKLGSVSFTRLVGQ